MTKQEISREALSGAWVSNFGLVELACEESGESGILKVSGFWGTLDQKKGRIDSGTFDTHTNVLELCYTEFYRGAAGGGELDADSGAIIFSFTESISSVNGTARFVLEDQRLIGVWTQQDKASGPWTMSRYALVDEEIQTASFASIAGSWQSDFGVVTLKQGEISDLKPVPVTGSWAGTDTEGVLEGHLDPKIGVLKFTYNDRARDAKGSCTMILSKDGRTMCGYWQEKGAKGTWTLLRE